MSYPTIPAYQTTSDGKQELPREHPVVSFLTDHQQAFDTGNMKQEPYTDFHTDDFTVTLSDGTQLAPGEASWRGWLQSYAPFSEHFHEARYACVYERDGLWEMVGFANLNVNLAVPGSEKTKTDARGRAWDAIVPGAFLFTCVEDPNGPRGFKVKAMKLFGNQMPVVKEMMKRGMLKPEDLAK